jgi:maleate cis-trans isomerase
MAPKRHRGVLAVPANNTTMEPELNALCPELAPFAVARVQLPGGTLTAKDIPAYSRNTIAAIADFLPRRPDIVVHGCTAAGFLVGREESERMTNELRNRCGATVVSTGAAMVDVLQHEEVEETAVVTPYHEAVDDGLRKYLASAGIAVEVLDGCECHTVEELGRITEDEVFDMAMRTVTPRSRALFIACSQLPTLGIIEPLRERLGIPVWSSIRATAWAASRAISQVA